MSLLVVLALAASGAWTLVEKTDGVELYQRELEGERVVELKAVTVSTLPVDTLCTAAFGGTTLDPAEPDITVRKVVSFDGGVRIAYEQISAPVVSDRDYAVKAVKEPLPNGGCRTRFEAANEHAPPLPKGFVRIEKLRGSWTFEPVGGGEPSSARIDGRSVPVVEQRDAVAREPSDPKYVVCTYTIFTDPGGSLPAVFVEGPRRKTALKWVKLVLQRAATAQRTR